MRKLLSLVLAFAMILGLFAFPVSADATTYQQVGQELVGLGVLKGVDAKGTLAEMQNLTREQALVVLTRLMGQEDKALATDAQPGFTDVPAAHWYSPYVAYAKLQGWTTGVSETEFGLGQSVTTKQVVTLMMRALGYTADWSKEDIMMKAKELGLLEGVSATADDAIIRGELFIVMKNTLYTKPMGEKAELIYKLGLAENPIPATLEVVDVKATNLREVVVEFNQEVDKTTLEDAFSAVGYTLGKITPELQEDGKTVVLTVERLMKNKENYKMTVSKVKSLSGVTMEKVTKEFKTEDNETPKVEKLVVTGPKNFQVIFSEPIAKAGTVKVKLDGKTVAGVSVKQDPTSERVFDATVASNLQDGKTYTVLVTGFEDFAKYKNIDSELELEYAKVFDAPTVEVVKAAQEYVELKFNRPVKGLALENFFHTYSAWKPVASYNTVEEMDKDVDKMNNVLVPTEARDKVVIRFIHTVDHFVNKANHNLHPLQVGDVEVNILGQVGSRKVVDNWGNQLQDTELMVSVSADKEAPVVESVEVAGEKEIEILFSKKVLLNRNNFELLNESGGKISGLAFTVARDGKKVTLHVGSPNLVGKTVILNVKDVKDDTINMNKMVGTESFNLTFGDKTFQGIKEAVLYVSHTQNTEYYANPTLFVSFSEAVDPQSAMDIKNYLFTKDVTLDEAKKSFFAVDADTSMYSDTIVQIVMSRETYLKKFGNEIVFSADKDGKFPLEVYISNNLKDVAGNSYNAFARFVRVKDASKKPVVKDGKVTASGYRTIDFSFDLPVMTKSYEIDKNQFLVGIDNGNDGILFNAKGELVDKKDVVLNIDSVEFNGSNGVKIQLEEKKYNDFRQSADAKKIVVMYTASANKDKRITNELGSPADNFVASFKAAVAYNPTGKPEDAYVQHKVSDEINPAFVQGHVATTDNVDKILYTFIGGYDHKFTVYFNEEMDDQTFSIHTFKLKGDDGSEYVPYRWRPMTIDGKTHVDFFFKVSSKAKIDNLKQELAASIDPNANVVVTNFDGENRNYYSYFEINLQDFNSARDMAKNGFGNTAVFPVYHTKATAEAFIVAASNLEGLELDEILGLELLDGLDSDVNGTTQKVKTSELAGNEYTANNKYVGVLGADLTYDWTVPAGAVKPAANVNKVTANKAGEYKVVVTLKLDGKTYKQTAKVTVVEQTELQSLTVTLAKGPAAKDHTVGKVKVSVAGAAPKVLLVNYPGEITTDTLISELLKVGKGFVNDELHLLKKDDVVTVVEYTNGVNAKAEKLGKETVTENHFTEWDTIANANEFVYEAGLKAGFKKVKVMNLLEGDKVELWKKSGATEAKLTEFEATGAEYIYMSAEKLVLNDEYYVYITRNGKKSPKPTTSAVVSNDDTAVTATAVGSLPKLTANTGEFDGEFRVLLTIDKDEFNTGLTADMFTVAAKKNDDTQVTDAKYKVGTITPSDAKNIIVTIVKDGDETPNPVFDTSAGTKNKFKVTVKSDATVQGVKDIEVADIEIEGK